MSEHIIQCWSCGASTTLNEIRTADGYCPECEAEIDLAEYYPKLAEVHYALHAEAEALRAENGRLKRTVDAGVENELEHVEERTRLRTKLEAARGLLEAARRIDREAGQHGTANVSMGAFKALEHSIARLDALTATPAPEVQAEQGERQEAFGYVLFGPGHVVDWTDDEEVARGWADAEGYSYKACYTTPQAGPDVRGLVESIQAAVNAVIVPVTMTPAKAEYYKAGARHIIAKVNEAIAAHRKAQRK